MGASDVDWGAQLRRKRRKDWRPYSVSAWERSDSGRGYEREVAAEYRIAVVGDASAESLWRSSMGDRVVRSIPLADPLPSLCFQSAQWIVTHLLLGSSIDRRTAQWPRARALGANGRRKVGGGLGRVWESVNCRRGSIKAHGSRKRGRALNRGFGESRLAEPRSLIWRC